MKNKYYLYSMLAATLALGGCEYNEEHFPGFDESAHPTHVWNDTITLAETDYKAIADNKLNKEIALSKDPEGESFANALKAVASNKYFTEDAQAAWYLPAFIAEKYPYMDNNSKVTVNYNHFENLPEYLKDFNGASTYTLSEDDYSLVWGESMKANFLTPNTLKQVPAILAAAIPDAQQGYMRVVEYAFSETEPGTGGGEVTEPVIYLEAAVGGNDGGLEAQNTVLDEGMSWIWSFSKNDSWWKASAFVGGSNKTAEGWLVTPEIDLTQAVAPVFNADLIVNHLKNGVLDEVASVKISTDYAGDVKTATWQDLDIKNWPAGNSWDPVNSGDVDLSAYNGKKVRIAFKYNSSSVSAPTWEVLNIYVKESGLKASMAQTRAASKPNAAEAYYFNGSNWEVYKTDMADVAVLQPADYDQMGYSYIGKPAETLPTYLKLTYPYAKADDVAVAVYIADKEGSIAASEFKYDGTTWILSTVAAPSTMTFQKADGNWIEARVYLESTFLNGESGGFTPQDIELSGLSYIWQLDNAYGWKGSGFSGGNHATESYLVSPEIDLSKATAPSLVFDVAINFLAGNDRKDFLNAEISTDYAGDATTATWEALDIAGWPEGTSWDFTTIESVSLEKYAGQKIRLAFHYKSTDTTAPTVEVKNLSIKE